MNACPNPDVLGAFGAGTLPAADASRVADHVASCPRCREALAVADQATTPLAARPRDPRPGLADLIAGYEILHEIHRGGQGVVYKAVQVATKRTVALKVLLHGPHASATQLHRFQREIDLVASIQHPNIVTVYDSGVAQGRYYFAMEYIHGKPLDAYLASAKLSVEATLRLFQKICSAVNSAHQRGVIHRDLKPANICIDADGEPHVLDFGLAKAAGPDLQDGAPVTVTGEFMGTPAYASPEHTSGDPRLIDIRADVYSLGVILFEMLTGDFPYPVIGPVSEVLRNIAEAQPRRPSALRRQIDNEVETIVLHALAKEKARRYQSADALARDVERYLAGEPLDARRDSTWYVLRKSLRRYRFAAGMTAALVLVLAASTVWLSIMSGNQRRAREQAIVARAEAQARTAELEIVTDFQQSMLGEIDAAAMGQALYADLGRRVREDLEAEGLPAAKIEAAVAAFAGTLRRANATDVAMELLDAQVLQRAAAAIEADFADQPILRAALQQTVADTHVGIGRYQSALPLQEEALRTRRAELGDDHPSTLASMNNLAFLYETLGRYDEAHDLYVEVLAGRRRVLGADHPLTLVSLNNLGLLVHRLGRYDEALRLYQEALAGRRRTLGEQHRDTLNSLNNLGTLHEEMGRYEEARDCLRQALAGNRLALGDDHPETLTVMNNLANLLHTMGEIDEALALQREALAIRRRTMGGDHPETLVSSTNLGVLLLSLGEYDEARAHFAEALEGWRRSLGDDHPNTLVAMSYLGVVLKRMGRLGEAEPYYREALEGNRRALGDDHASTVRAVHNMGKLLRDLGRYDEAETCGARAVAWARASLPAGHVTTAAFLASHGRTLARQERHEEAEAALLESYGILEAAVGGDHRRSVDVAGAIVDLYDAWHAVEPGAGHDGEAAAWRAKLGREPAAQ